MGRAEQVSDEREIKFHEILKSLLDRSKTTVTHKKLASAINVSPTTVSHYVTGRIKPSFDALIGISVFFNVPLDYLVFGERTRKEAAGEPQSLRTDVLRALAESNNYVGRQRDLVLRVSRALFGEVERVAQGMLDNPENFGPAGFITDEEAMALESCARRTKIMIRGAPADIKIDASGAGEPGDYFDTIVDNLSAGRTYQFVFYGRRAQYLPLVKAYRELLGRAEVDPGLVHENLEFRVIDTELPTGIMIHELDVSQLQRREPVLWERFRDDGIVDGTLAYSAVRHQDALGGVVLYDAYLESAVRLFQKDWEKAGIL
jgi:transcriptional regulator with XRE-family HTH domain